MPDFQGFGFGVIFLNEIAKIYINDNFRVIITTNNPALIFSLKKNNNWYLKRIGRTATNTNGILKNTKSSNKITTSWEYKKN